MKLKKLSAACLAALISTVGLHSFMPESGFNSTAYAAETITGDANRKVQNFRQMQIITETKRQLPETLPLLLLDLLIIIILQK